MEKMIRVNRTRADYPVNLYKEKCARVFEHMYEVYGDQRRQIQSD